MLRKLTLLLAVTLAPAAHAGGQVAAEVARYDMGTDVFAEEMDSDGTLYGVFGELRSEGPLFLAAQGRALTGEVEHDITNTGSTTDTSTLLEARGLVGGRVFGEVTAYTGAGYRRLAADITDDGERTGQTIYVPLGLTAANAIPGSDWRVRTEIEAGIVVWGEEELEATVAGTGYDETFTRSSGWQARFAMTFQKGAFTIAPFLRAYGLDETDEETIGGTDYWVEGIRTTEAGARIGLAF